MVRADQVRQPAAANFAEELLGWREPPSAIENCFHRTVKEEFFSVAFRKTMYGGVAQLQADLDAYVTFYNRERVHQGYRTQGRRPYRAFCDGLVVRPPQEVTGDEDA